MSDTRQPLRFYVNGLVALTLLFFLSLTMAPAPEVSYLRALIVVGFAIVAIKMVIRLYRPHWLPIRYGGSRRR